VIGRFDALSITAACLNSLNEDVNLAKSRSRQISSEFTNSAQSTDHASFLTFSNKKAQLSLTNPHDACEKFAWYT